MKKYLLIIIFLTSVNLFAFDWGKYGIERNSGNDSSSAEFRDRDGNVFYIENEESLKDSAAEKIIEIKNIIYKWKYIEISRLKFLVKPNEIEVSVIPSSFTYNKTDVMTNIKAGLLFSYSDESALRYNFRILTKNVFVRISGVYLDEDLLCKKIVEAVKDPQSFIQRRDADYFLSRIEKLDSKIEQLEAQVADSDRKVNNAVMAFQNDRFFAGKKPISEELITEVIKLKDENPKITRDEIKEKLTAKKIKYSEKELKIILAVYFGEI
ncbi:MAG: hypothetical protein JW982_04025 [Spirochaetes bacterium]|nr:hypothetical protein [Spirochaetota bacterium]